MADRRSVERAARMRAWRLAPLALVAGLWLPYACSPPESARIRDVARTEATRFVPLSRGITHYEVDGPADGPPVVLIPGLSVPLYCWDPTVPALAQAGLRAIRYDLYGRGLSDRPEASAYDLALYDAQLSELIDRLAPGRPVDLVGLSMGGIVAAEFTRRHPERVRRVVLIDPAGVGADIPVMAQVALWPGLGEYVMRVGGGRQLLPAKKNLLHPERFPDFDRRFLDTARFEGSRRAVLESLRHMPLDGYEDGFRAFGALGKPTLLVWGKGDSRIPFAASDRVRALVHPAGFLPVEDAGHLAHYERPEVVNPAVTAFLTR